LSYQSISFDLCFKNKEVKKEKVVVAASFQSGLLLQLINGFFGVPGSNSGSKTNYKNK
jgi:hypothetical protein